MSTRYLVLFLLIVLQTTAEVLPMLDPGIPWTQPQAMYYGGFVFIGAVIVCFLVLR
jgi:hypothetical protein